MSSFDPTIDAPFREYAELQLQRHKLLSQGLEDASATSAAEDRMEQLWEKFDKAQRRSLSGMGSDLNWIRRKFEPSPKGRKTPEEVGATDLQELVAAIGAKEWHKVLHYLRLCTPSLSAASLAHMRGSAYEGIGLPSYASVFNEQGLQIDPANHDIGALRDHLSPQPI